MAIAVYFYREMACITLLSDFGPKDASAAIARGILMQYSGGMPVLDISHEVTPYHTAEAAYLLSGAYGHFPAGSWHVALFDLFSTSPLKLVLCGHHGHYFVTPDNGLIPMALGTPEKVLAYHELKAGNTFSDWLHLAGKMISELPGNSTVSPEAQALKTASDVKLPRISPNEIACDVVHIDRYENVVLNVARSLFESARQGRNFRISFMEVEELTELSNYYNDVPPGYKLCRFNSNHHLEICINRGKAASLFGLRLEGKNNRIKIEFE
jgi:S-adenosylmethionine hydrolase